MTYKELSVGDLRWRCDPSSLGFKSTDEIESCDEILGQERALKAIKLGLEVKSPGYNIYIAGLTGTGKTTTIKHILERIDAKGQTPDDLCYVYNFSHPDAPKVLRLAAGKGRQLARDMAELVQDLKTKLPQILESEQFEKRRKEVTDSLKQTTIQLFKNLEEKVRKAGFAVVKVEMGPISRPEIFPVIDGQVLSWEQLNTQVEKGEFEGKKMENLLQKHESLMEDLEKTLRENRHVEREFQKQLSDLKGQVCLPIVTGMINDLKEKYQTQEARDYLDEVQNHVMQNLERFRDKEEKEPPVMFPGAAMPVADEFIEFQVNVVVDNSALKGVPVVIETAPNYRNLFGTIERVLDRTGVWRTDFTRIKAGALLKANGGYLVLNLIDALIEPGVWVALKRTLKNRKLDIQAYDPFYFYSSTALKPEAVDIDVKVAIIGDSHFYQLLYFLDEDFKKIFKVKADFDTVMAKDELAAKNYSRFVKKICDDEGLLPFTNTGVAEIIEYGVRLAGRRKKISTRFSDIADLIREAQYWAREDGGKKVTGEHVRQAVDEKIYRSRLIEDKIQEMIEDGVLMIDIEGAKVGQVNGLSVYDLGDYSFGRPTKITAEVSMGRAGIINIEREADLSGKTHDKGVLIIGGYFRGKYAQDKPLSMSASLAFEQSYSGVDGDSASSTEIYAILSELSGLPLRQDIAVTGSVNQKGEIQPIGGVNQKIEGFFDVCRAKGLTGQQGAIIPHQNVEDLMLKPEVVDAVEKGNFHVFPVRTVDEGIEILTGVAAGEKADDGAYPENSVNFRVDRRLRELAQGMKQFVVDSQNEAKRHERQKS